MNDTKEKSAVGTAIPATEKDIENLPENIISSNDRKIKMIPIENLLHHPDNPRKDIGDISELTDSIRKNGIMQNLTVVPYSGRFLVLIGNRRLEAAKAAGLKYLPCKIVEGLSKVEQVGIMLEENMQRNDLTVIEQAQGFQLMFDLGETVHTISQRTGFSETTVRRRLSIAQLDSEILTEAFDEWQVSLDDLRELEKIKDIKKRNKLLKRAGSSDNLRYFISNELREEKMAVCQREIKKLLKKAGIPADPDAKNLIWYNDKYEIVKRYELTDEPPKRLSFKVEKDLVYTQSYRTIYIIRKKEKAKKELTDEEKKQRQIRANCKKVKEITRQIDTEMKDFVAHLMIEQSTGLIGCGPSSQREERWAWDILAQARAVVSGHELAAVFLNKESWQINNKDCESVSFKLRKVPIIVQMAYTAICSLRADDPPIQSWSGKFLEERVKVRNEVYSLIQAWGFRFPEDREQEFEDILDGSSELYMKEVNSNGKHDSNS